MAITPNVITRSGAEALIPQQISDEIIQALPTQSVALRLMRQMPRMTSKQTKIPVMTGLATAGFVSGDTGNGLAFLEEHKGNNISGAQIASSLGVL